MGLGGAILLQFQLLDAVLNDDIFMVRITPKTYIQLISEEGGGGILLRFHLLDTVLNEDIFQAKITQTKKHFSSSRGGGGYNMTFHLLDAVLSHDTGGQQ